MTERRCRRGGTDRSGADGPSDLVRFRKTLTERIFTQFQGAPEGDLAYCMERLDIDIEQLDRPVRAAS